MTNEEIIKLIDEQRALPKENEWVEFKTGNVTSSRPKLQKSLIKSRITS